MARPLPTPAPPEQIPEEHIERKGRLGDTPSLPPAHPRQLSYAQAVAASEHSSEGEEISSGGDKAELQRQPGPGIPGGWCWHGVECREVIYKK